MKPYPKIKAITNFIYDRCSKDIGAIIIGTTTAGWVASSAAQTLGILHNSKYTNEQKKFMVNQELADATINILSYFAITLPIKYTAAKLVKTGKIISGPTKDIIKAHKETSKLGHFDFNLTKVPYFSELEKTYSSFSNFMSTGSAVLGGVISSNLVTPILRNRFASKKQSVPSARFDKINNPDKSEQINNKTAQTIRHISSFEQFKHKSLSI